MTLKWVRGAVCCWGAALVIVISASANQRAGDESGFTPLFNGKDLTGWVYGGSKDKPAKEGNGYQVDADQKVVYSTKQDGGKLLTEKEYGDFVLRFEFRLETNGNNGIGIRA